MCKIWWTMLSTSHVGADQVARVWLADFNVSDRAIRGSEANILSLPQTQHVQYVGDG